MLGRKTELLSQQLKTGVVAPGRSELEVNNLGKRTNGKSGLALGIHGHNRVAIVRSLTKGSHQRNLADERLAAELVVE